MTIPILLVGGFLGAGKTTLVNEILRHPDGLLIAAVVNDFGAIDIDAELLSVSAEGVVSLRNGCICCSLQGDLMRTLATLIRREPRPDAIVIETSGASDPAEIVRSLLDPVVYTVTPLETVVTVVDARHLADRPALFDEPLWRSQVAAADFCVLSKTDLVDGAELGIIRAGLARHKAPRHSFDAGADLAPVRRFFARDVEARHRPTRRARPSVAEDRFETVSWTARAPLALSAFQGAIGRLAPRLLRAKGFVTFAHDPGRTMLFQLVGSRATIVPAEGPAGGEDTARLVLIAEAGRLDPDEAIRILDEAAGAAEVRSGRP